MFSSVAIELGSGCSGVASLASGTSSVEECIEFSRVSPRGEDGSDAPGEPSASILFFVTVVSSDLLNITLCGSSLELCGILDDLGETIDI